MERIVLLAVAAAWAAVLLPPLLRSRTDNRPGSSVSDFSRQLSSLQRSVPTRGMAPMRSMSRPLTNSPLARPAIGQGHRVLSMVPAHRDGTSAGPLQRRSHGEPNVARIHGEAPHRDHVVREQREHGLREHSLREHGRREHGHRQAQVQRSSSPRAEVRRRRTNVLFMLTMSFFGALFLAATTKSTVMTYALALTFLSLVAYCYLLVQLRDRERRTPQQDSTWFRAA